MILGYAVSLLKAEAERARGRAEKHRREAAAAEKLRDLAIKEAEEYEKAITLIGGAK